MTSAVGGRAVGAALALALTVTALHGPAPARADALDDAYSDGKLFGAGIPMLSWGLISTTNAIFTIAEKGDIDTSDAFPLSIGLTQMATGGTLLGIGASGRPDGSPGRSAFDAGANVGGGITMIVYGSLMTLATGFLLLDILDYPEEDNGWAWVAFSVGLALSGFQIGYGAYMLSTGSEDFDKLRAGTQATGQPLLSLPLASFQF